MSKIYLIRHGQASFLEENYDQLSKKGMMQSEALGNYFLDNEIHFDKIYIGNLKRHQQTYDGFSKAFKTNGVSIRKPIYLKELNEHEGLLAFNDALKEFVFKNKKAQILYEKIEKDQDQKKKYAIQIFALFMKDFVAGKYPENDSSIQSWSEFRKQTKKGISNILNSTNKGETIGIFTSGGTKSSILGDSLGLEEEKIGELNLAIRNTSFSQLFFSNKKFILLSINEVPHLTKKLITFV